MRATMTMMTIAAFSAPAISAYGAETYTAKAIATFPAPQVPNGLMTADHGAIYGIAYDYTNYSDANPYVANWVYRISEEGAFSNPCLSMEAALGSNVVFDRHGNGYTLGANGVMRFTATGQCQLVATLGSDLTGMVNGDLTIAPSETIYGSTRSGQLFFVDFAHKTTKVITTFPMPGNAPGAFLTGIAAAPDREDGISGTFIWQTPDGNVASQLFTYQFAGSYKNIFLFGENVWMRNVAFAGGDRFAASGPLGGYLLSSSGKVLSSKIAAQDYPITLRDDRVFYTSETVTVGTGRYPPTKTNYFVTRSRLDGAAPERLVDITAFGTPTSEVLPGPDDKLYVITFPTGSGPKTLVEVFNSLNRFGRRNAT